MIVKATITLEITYELDANLTNKELFNMEKVYLENNFLDFIGDRIEDGCDIKVNAHVVEA